MSATAGEEPIVPRFRSGQAWYVAASRGGLVECLVWAPAERLLRTTSVLLGQLDPAVDVAIESRRDGRVWRGERLAVADVQVALAALQRPLATHGGVELSVYTPDDQLTVDPALLLVIVSRSPRWTYQLDALGFAARERVPPPDWDPSLAPYHAAPDLAAALDGVVAQLGLVPRGATV